MSSVPVTEDTGFCSGEEYMESEIHSPTDNSEDSVEVKVSVISSLCKNKRKLQEPSRKRDVFSGPLKKRMCLKIKAESNETLTPFRPWSPPTSKTPSAAVSTATQNFAVPFPLKSESITLTSASNLSYFRPPSPVPQTEPVSLVIKREQDDSNDVRVPMHPPIAKLSAVETERMILKTNEQFPTLQVEAIAKAAAPTLQSSTSKKTEQRREQRNYKNMTRERRIEANARERTRVHTISAAFDTLRRAVPAYSHNQKLSKLSVLRIACSYIMTLSSLVSSDNSEPVTSECVDMVSRTIQREGKLRKKKDDND
ncbi:transcription factor atoh8 isoform X2 [Cylas formicarius]|nr:transcription factor atoh8 isoform X2 [Cylas formicarius]